MDTRSQELFEAAKKKIPGGVNSPVRAFGAVGRTPRFIASAKGSRITDVDGNEMIDYVCSWGPGILGHAHPRVIEDLRRAHRERSRSGRIDLRTDSFHGDEPPRQLRHRGRHERHPRG